jgi:predicted dehydrogenase
MPAKPYRAAVIGHTGRGDYGHGLDVALLNRDDIRVVAVADPDPAGRAAAARRLGVANAYDDFRAMLEREAPQIVAVAPRWLDGHEAMILACAEAGARAIFCEKPLAPDLKACDAIVDACAKAHVHTAMAFQTRYSPRFERVQELVKAGAIGEVLELRGRGKEDRRGGGEDLMVLGTHVLDLFRALLGDARWAFARVTDGGQPLGPASVRPGAEGIGPLAGDRVDALYGFAGTPAVAHFATSRPRRPGARFGLGIYGSEGYIQMGTGWRPPAFLMKNPSWGLSGRAQPEEITSAGVGKPETEPADSLAAGNRAIVADLVRAIETDRPPRATVADGRAAIEMILACYASQDAGAPVPLPLADRAVHPLERLRAAGR